ncbi:MAG TPA: BMP family ABC transporter substrate-binding protein [Anaerolineae bacterium]|nr:BMP family ABC transporter substrate-binding protein [Anaerolineae bacterium]
MKTYLVLLLTGVLTAFLVACGAAPTPGGGAADQPATEQQPAAEPPAADQAEPSGEPLQVILFVNGVLGDKSFFDSSQRGVDQAKAELGIEAKTIEAGIDETQWEPALIDAAANEDYDVFIVGTFQMATYLEQVAAQYPDKKFIIYDSGVNYESGCCDNVYSILYKQNEGSYLAGVYAGAMTTQAIDGMNPETVIGSVGGQEIPVIVDFMVGYEQGARDTNPDVQVIRQFAGGWFDPAKGKELAKAQYSQGADIVFQIAGGTGQGVFEAATEDGRYAIGVDSDQALIIEESDPDQAARILTSMMKNVDTSLFRALDLHLKGELPYGQVESLGIAEGGVGLARNKFYDQNTPDEVKALVDAAEQKIVNGEITVETAFQ